MGTSALLAIDHGIDLLGVYCWLDGHPHYMGNQLLLDVLDAHGDLDACARTWVMEAPEWGYRSFCSRKPRNRADAKEPSRWRVADFPRLAGLLGYVYVLDRPTRHLRVWTGVRQLDDPPLYAVTFNDQGLANPPVFAEPYLRPPDASRYEGPEPDFSADYNLASNLLSALGFGPSGTDDLADPNPDRLLAALATAAGMTSARELALHIASRIQKAIRDAEWEQREMGSIETTLRQRVGQIPATLPTEPDDRYWLCNDRWTSAPAWCLVLDECRIYWPVSGSERNHDRGRVLMRSDGRHTLFSLHDVLGEPLEKHLLQAEREAGVPGAQDPWHQPDPYRLLDGLRRALQPSEP